jgi:hypothetical protein
MSGVAHRTSEDPIGVVRVTDNRVIAAALRCSLVGHGALSRTGEGWWLSGLGECLVGHVGYRLFG